MSGEKRHIEEEEHRDQRIEKIGQLTLDQNEEHKNIHLLSIIGEIEGHDNLSGNSKTTKYEHILPQLAAIEDSSEIDGVLVILNTMGGDVEAGLAIAEMLASLSKPTVSLVLGGSHSIGVPIAVSTRYSFIVPTGTSILNFCNLFTFSIYKLNFHCIPVLLEQTCVRTHCTVHVVQ